jgi:hypothetical protein
MPYREPPNERCIWSDRAPRSVNCVQENTSVGRYKGRKGTAGDIRPRDGLTAFLAEIQ